MRHDLRTLRGERIELDLRPGATVFDAITALEAPPYRFNPGTRLMLGSRLLDGRCILDEFPDGTVIVVGERQSGEPPTLRLRPGARSPKLEDQPAPRQQPSAAAGQRRSNGPYTVPGRLDPAPPQHTRPGDRGSNREVPISLSGQGASPMQLPVPTRGSPVARGPPQPTNAEKSVIQLSPDVHATTPTVTPRGTMPIKLRLAVPAFNEVLDVTLVDNATLQDLVVAAVAMDKRLVGMKTVFRGKLISGDRQQLRDFGIHDGDVLHVAVGNVGTNKLTLLYVQDELQKAAKQAAEAPTVLEKKALYELTMRLLFKLDSLEDLPSELRAEKKDLIHRVQSFQDSLGIDS